MERLFNWQWVEAQVAQTIHTWSACAARPLPPGNQYTPQEQLRRESAYDAGLKAVEQEAKKAPRSRDERLEAQRRVVAVFPRFASIALGLDDTAVQLLTDGFLPVGTELASWE